MSASTPSSSSIFPFPNDAWREHLRSQCEKVWCGTLDAAGINFRVVLLNMAAAAALLAIADDVAADMIVVGRRGQGGFDELLLGSAPHWVAHYARWPVVSVPAS